MSDIFKHTLNEDINRPVTRNRAERSINMPDYTTIVNMSSPCIIRESTRGFDQIPIEDELLVSREIFLTEPVDPGTMKELFRQLLFLSREDPGERITLYINSPGGEVMSGLAVYDYMKLIPTPVRTVCIGEAASMGAILFLAGDERIMFPDSRIMIHDPAFGNGLKAGMKPDEMDEVLAHLKKTRDRAVDIISSVTGRTQEEVREKTRKDSFFSAEEAVDFGLATSIVTKETITEFTSKKKGR